MGTPDGACSSCVIRLHNSTFRPSPVKSSARTVEYVPPTVPLARNGAIQTMATLVPRATELDNRFGLFLGDNDDVFSEPFWKAYAQVVHEDAGSLDQRVLDQLHDAELR